MERHSSENTTIINYLLGEGSDEQREKLEERYFSDDDLFARLLDVEDQLIHDYLQNRLSGDLHQQFERHYLTLPHKRRKVELARRLRQVPVQKVFTPAQHPDPQGFVAWLRNWRLVSSLAAAVILLSIGFATWRIVSTTQSPAEFAATPSPTVSGAPITPAASISPANGATRFVSLLVSPELLRGNDTESSRTAFTTSATEQITINLLVPPGKAAKYRASLEKLDDPGQTIQTSDSLRALSQDNKTIVTWTFNVALLPPDDYEIKLFSLDPNNAETLTGSYKFQVRQRN